MSFLERLGELTKSVLTTDAEMKNMREGVSEVRREVHGLVDKVQNVSERVTRLEAGREADRAQAQAEIARFKAEVERAEMRLSRLLPAPDEKPEN